MGLFLFQLEPLFLLLTRIETKVSFCYHNVTLFAPLSSVLHVFYHHFIHKDLLVRDAICHREKSKLTTYG